MTGEKQMTSKGTESSAPAVPRDGGVSGEPQKGRLPNGYISIHFIRTTDQVSQYAYSLLYIYIYLMLQEDNWSSTPLIQGKLDIRRCKIGTLIS